LKPPAADSTDGRRRDHEDHCLLDVGELGPQVSEDFLAGAAGFLSLIKRSKGREQGGGVWTVCKSRSIEPGKRHDMFDTLDFPSAFCEFPDDRIGAFQRSAIR
jgi:hypothetical protein